MKQVPGVFEVIFLVVLVCVTACLTAAEEPVVAKASAGRPRLDPAEVSGSREDAISSTTDATLICGNGEGVAGSAGNIVPVLLENPSIPVRGVQYTVIDQPDLLVLTAVTAVLRATGFIASFSEKGANGAEVLCFSLTGDSVSPGGPEEIL